MLLGSCSPTRRRSRSSQVITTACLRKSSSNHRLGCPYDCYGKHFADCRAVASAILRAKSPVGGIGGLTPDPDRRAALSSSGSGDDRFNDGRLGIGVVLDVRPAP